MRNPVLDAMARFPMWGTSFQTTPDIEVTPPTSMPPWLDIEQKFEMVGVTRPCSQVLRRSFPPTDAMRASFTS